MNTEITIQISERVLQRASIIAEQTQQKPEDILQEWLEETVDETRMEDLTDEEILHLTESTFNEIDQNLFSELLEKNRLGIINLEEKLALDNLTRQYEIGLLRKSKALRIAVERNLILPLAK